MLEREDELVQLLKATHWLMEVLCAVRELGPANAYVAAGAIRDTVWDVLTGRSSQGPVHDLDVVYFDAGEDSIACAQHESKLVERLPGYRWEVTNQATVHLWHTARGIAATPVASVREGLATWPETATAVGARLTTANEIEVVAPFGLEDLFELTVRHNPVLAGPDVYMGRIRDKRWRERWPALRVLPPLPLDSRARLGECALEGRRPQER